MEAEAKLDAGFGEDRDPPCFSEHVRAAEPRGLRRGEVRTLQLNVGKLCNMSCRHCHVDAGPARREIMGREVAERVLYLLRRNPSVRVLDLTGGAPELNPHFRWLVAEARGLGREVLDRCNLTVLFEPGQEDLAEFLAAHQVRVVASLPCYGAENVDEQRGRGAFDKSIRALRRLNELGYGQDPRLGLDLVYNPLGASLPPPQAELERRYKEELDRRFGVRFDRLLTLTNLPVQRFAAWLEKTGQRESYLRLLAESFNPATLPGLMCRSLLSIGWDGAVYDCDFNQMIGLSLGGGPARTVWDLDDLSVLVERPIATRGHCLGCTAGAGSSCSGAIQ